MRRAALDDAPVAAFPPAPPGGGGTGRADRVRAGGVTTLMALPDTDPPLDEPALVQFVARRGVDGRPKRHGALGPDADAFGGVVVDGNEHGGLPLIGDGGR